MDYEPSYHFVDDEHPYYYPERALNIVPQVPRPVRKPVLPTVLRLRSPATLPAQSGNQLRCKPRLEGLILPQRQTSQHPRHARQQRKMIT
jgi:hypothetical protein